MSEANGMELYTTQRNEHVKQYIEMGGQGRPYKVYTAASSCPVGGPCEVTIYGYLNVNSTTIVARKEGRGEWTQAFQDVIDAL